MKIIASASFILSILLLTLISGCASSPSALPDASNIRNILTGRNQKLMAALSKKDAAELAGFFTEDATWILPNATTYRGRAAIERGAQAIFDSIDSL